jgi:hypothetical protein
MNQRSLLLALPLILALAACASPTPTPPPAETPALTSPAGAPTLIYFHATW